MLKRGWASCVDADSLSVAGQQTIETFLVFVGGSLLALLTEKWVFLHQCQLSDAHGDSRVGPNKVAPITANLIEGKNIIRESTKENIVTT